MPDRDAAGFFPTHSHGMDSATEMSERNPIPDEPPPRPSTGASQALMKPLARLLRPLVRLLIRRGVTFPVLADLLRALYVEVSVQDVLKEAKARTDSRISLLTGVHRKEIRRLRASKAAPEDVPEVVTRGSQIIARWLATPAYLDDRGQPLPLPRARDPQRAGPSFEDLVESVTKDVRPRAVLDEWLAQDIVTLGPDDRVRLDTAALVPRAGGSEQLFYFARNLHDHLAAACANVMATGRAPYLDRSVHYDRLVPEIAAAMEASAREGAQGLLMDINRKALEMLEAEERAGGGADAPGRQLRRVNLGVYLYVEDEREDLGS
jgi:hypothetical protein